MSLQSVGQEDDSTQRERLGKLLKDGLETGWRRRAYVSEDVNAVVAQLQALAPDDEIGRLKTAGFTLEPYVAEDNDIEQACSTCMYYQQGRQFCTLPELKLPVLPQWSCRLWRI